MRLARGRSRCKEPLAAARLFPEISNFLFPSIARTSKLSVEKARSIRVAIRPAAAEEEANAGSFTPPPFRLVRRTLVGYIVVMSLRGQFLVASPHLPDPNFYRSVVLMLQHDDEGAFGVVMNRPTPSTVREIWELVADLPCSSERPVNLGGPVSGPLLALHTHKDLSESEVLPGVYVSTQKEFLNEIVQRDDAPFLLFSGYAGWAGGQLEDELEAGGWLTTPASVDDIFVSDDELWKRIVHRIGSEILSPMIKRGKQPVDPSWN